MKLSPEGLALLEQREGVVPTMYRDSAGLPMYHKIGYIGMCQLSAGSVVQQIESAMAPGPPDVGRAIFGRNAKAIKLIRDQFSLRILHGGNGGVLQIMNGDCAIGIIVLRGICIAMQNLGLVLRMCRSSLLRQISSFPNTARFSGSNYITVMA